MVDKFKASIQSLPSKERIDYTDLIARSRAVPSTEPSYDELSQRLRAAEWALALLIEIQVQHPGNRSHQGLREYAERIQAESHA